MPNTNSKLSAEIRIHTARPNTVFILSPGEKLSSKHRQQFPILTAEKLSSTNISVHKNGESVNIDTDLSLRTERYLTITPESNTKIEITAPGARITLFAQGPAKLLTIRTKSTG